MKRCKKCKKSRPTTEFYQNQAGCKQCSKDMKNLENHARKSNEIAWFRSLSESEKDSLLQQYNREKERACKENTRVSFSLTQYKKRTLHSSGLRSEGRRRYMSEVAFLAWARTPEGGHLTQAQAEAKWAEMCEDIEVPRRGEGVGLQLAVHVYDELVDFNELAHQREIERLQKLNNKMTAEQLEGKTRDLVIADHKDGGAPDSRICAAAIQNESEEKDGLVIPSVAELANKRRRLEPEGDCEAHEDAAIDNAGQKAEGKEPCSSPTRWFDVQAERARAARQLKTFMNKKIVAMASVREAMKEAQDAARATVASNPSKDGNFVIELRILSNRLEAASLVQDGSPEEFAKYVARINSSSTTAIDGKSQCSAAQDLALASAGPCHNFEKLYTFGQSKNLGDLLQACNSQADLDGAWKQIKSIGGHWEELMAACKTATTDLQKAVGNKGKKPGGQPKGKAKAKAKSSKAAPMYQIFDIDLGTDIASFNDKLPDDHDMSRPFILRRAAVPALLKDVHDRTEGNETTKLINELKEFNEIFNKSDIRFTAGKGQCALSVASHDQLKECLKTVASSRTPVFAEPHQTASCFGVIGKHRSVQFEVAGIGGYRFADSGSRHIVLLSTLALLDMVEKRNNKQKEEERDKITFSSTIGFASYMDEDDMEELVNANATNLFRAVMEPGDLLYTPAGLVVGEQITSAEDHSGIKMSLVFTEDTAGVNMLRKLQMEAKDNNKKNAALDDLIAKIEAASRPPPVLAAGNEQSPPENGDDQNQNKPAPEEDEEISKAQVHDS
eukprot:Skav228532  [mRNA]  locus=scaffold1887:1225:3868:+ [translate_table: standard]